MNREEFLQNVRAFLKFANSRDQQMPDPGEHADLHRLLHDPPDLDRLWDLCGDQYSENPYGVVWGSRKQDLSLRKMVLANPFAELHLRTLLHPVADQLIDAQTEHALAGRIDLLSESSTGARALTTVNNGSIHGRYRKRLAGLKSRGDTAGVRTDIRRCYHEVTPDAVARAFALIDLGNVGTLVGLALRKCAADTGLDGLPINPETSAWIANIVFRRSDLGFAGFPQVGVARWSDDYVLFAQTPQLVFECFSELRTNLGVVGLHIAEGKTYLAPQHGLTVSDLIDMRTESQWDIWESVDAEDADRLGDLLLQELKELAPSPSRLRALLGQCGKPSIGAPENLPEILDYLLEFPSSWEQCSARAGTMMARLANPEQRFRMLETAIDLTSEGLVGSEQIVHLLQSAISGGEPLSSETPRNLAMRMWRVANTNECIPVRGWARRLAFEIDPDWVNERIIYAGQFQDLHPFEQRWATLFASPRQDQWWLQGQSDHGPWPSMAEARINSDGIH